MIHQKTKPDVAEQKCRRSDRVGWTRAGDPEHGFTYHNSRGAPITNERKLSRIKELAIPPAWSDVHISASAEADLQATGIDAAGRKQYIYHPDFVARQAERKYQRLRQFAQHLPELRARTSEDLASTNEPTELRVLATMVRLINEAYFRAGSEEYTRRYRSYGITTLLKRHVHLLEDETLLFQYRGKSGVRQRQVVTDGDLFAVVKSLMEISGRRLFQYYDDRGEVHPATGRLLNQYIRQLMGPGISAKDFRTWAGTLLAAETLAELGPPESERQAEKNIVAAIKRVAEELGNTPAVARASYVSPSVIERYREGKTLDDYVRRSVKTIRASQLDYEPEELALMRLLGLRLPLGHPEIGK
ncbi:MAG TPA: hypothetical protein VKU87_11040 [Thermomicrobiaceae bacterium]|nr:hypothetical protein [Thermomicrobiaceae bacterium]